MFSSEDRRLLRDAVLMYILITKEHLSAYKSGLIKDDNQILKIQQDLDDLNIILNKLEHE